MKKFEKRGFVYIGIEDNCSVFRYKGRKLRIPTGALSSGYINAMLRKLPTLERAAERLMPGGDLHKYLSNERYQGIAVWDLVVWAIPSNIRKPNTYMYNFVQQFAQIKLNYLPSHNKD